jgi:pimeloyl-ACP methyl ester carboxylesterase
LQQQTIVFDFCTCLNIKRCETLFVPIDTMFTVLLVVILICIIIFKFRERLTFQYGRLTRPHDRTMTKSITQMGPDQFIELSFGTVHYIYRPSSLRSLPLNIFVHGYSTPMEMWQDIFQSLVKDNQPCLVYDLYGRGWSDSPHIPMNIDIFVCQLAELLYALNLPYEKYNLFGVSMGGAIVQRFTELYPSKVSKLVLCCSAGLNLVKPAKILFFILSIPMIGPIVFKFVMQRRNEKKERLSWAFPDNGKYKQHKELFQSGCQQHPGFLRALFSTLTSFDFEASLKSIEVIAKLNIPILIIWGDKDDLIPVDNAYRFHQLYKNSSLTIVPGATHMILLEHSEQIIDPIRAFLKK